jgi:hypothetical protein
MGKRTATVRLIAYAIDYVFVFSIVDVDRDRVRNSLGGRS